LLSRIHGEKTVSALPSNTTGTHSSSHTVAEQLAAKESQLRAMENRVATAEAALARLRGTSLVDDTVSTWRNTSEQSMTQVIVQGYRNLSTENRTLQMDVDRLRAHLEEKDKQLSALREETSSWRTARMDTHSDRRYDEVCVCVCVYVCVLFVR
jgi:regulator of replication initiation timing